MNHDSNIVVYSINARNESNYRYLYRHYEDLYHRSVEELRKILEHEFPSKEADEFSPTQSFTKSYYDPILQDKERISNDSRYGIALIIRPPLYLYSPIQTFLSEVRAVIGDDQYFYPNEDLHLTLLSIIPCFTTFSLNDIRISDYVETINVALRRWRQTFFGENGVNPSISNDTIHQEYDNDQVKSKRIRIHLKGITASTSCVMIQGFVLEEVSLPDPGGFPSLEGEDSKNAINDLRDTIRQTFQDDRPDLLLRPIDLRYRLVTAHLTVLRLSRPFRSKEQGESYLRVLEKYREYDFGSFIVDKVDFIGNDWYVPNSKVQLLHQFTLPH